MTDLTAADILEGARAIIAKPGQWHKGGSTSPDGTAFCGYMAIAIASSGLTELPFPTEWPPAAESFKEAYSVLKVAFFRLHPDSPFGFSVWQDAPERTLDEVLEVFDRAIKIARS